ncbi:NUDIX domain-containing protein [Leptospira koniambonensis]|uniref:NUDIX domain-containing protein n=1 Tax=Leptospira koniambonensis TaxID=2484950 RepID=UPI003EBBE908
MNSISRDSIEAFPQRDALKSFTEISEQDLYLFYSFDLTNSTEFKSKESSRWPEVFNKFYELIELQFKDENKSVHLWKYNGDEVLFYEKIRRASRLFEAPEIALKTLTNVVASLHEIFKELPEIKRISIKGIVWIAPVAKIPKTSIKKAASEVETNYVIYIAAEEQSLTKDFIGPDIDTGFRLGKYVEKGNLAVSAELAYILSYVNPESGIDKSAEIGKYKIISYEVLKGVWGGRAYPIIWYSKDWNSLAGIFEYDDHLSSKLIERIKEKKFEPIDILGKILKSANRDYIQNHYLGIIERDKGSTTLEKEDATRVISSRLSEVHCVAVVIFNDKVLLAKRVATKRRLPGIWEFGCAQLKFGKSIEECMMVDYKEDFGIEINPSPLRPISTYQITNDDGSIIPGIIFAAVSNSEKLREDSNKKHSEIKWFSNSDIRSLGDQIMVPEAKECIRLAFEAFR